MTQAVSIITAGWTAFSVGATLAGLGGIGLILVALLFAASLPAWVRRPLVGVGILLLAGAALFQAGQTRGAHQAFAVEAAKTLKRERAEAAAALAEVKRQGAARQIVAARDAQRAAAAETEAKASAERLRALQAYLAGTKDRACGSAEDARRLRAL
ncbi:hypothetical protein B2G69_07805 [Methylorubrum zatmanii]|nr:hypothetical protein [Methylorubrum zatmanii]ARO54059.1 hypothetical protein B2G69_07805 [Methylorubrum zatmanii]